MPGEFLATIPGERLGLIHSVARTGFAIIGASGPSGRQHFSGWPSRGIDAGALGVGIKHFVGSFRHDHRLTQGVQGAESLSTGISL